MYEVIGIMDRTNQKTGKRICMVYLVTESPAVEGRACDAIWVSPDLFDKLALTVGEVVGAPSYNRRGFFNGFLPVRD